MRAATLLILAGVGLMQGCGERNDSGPPSIRLGDSVCDECNMIISDERWATATIVRGERGADARLFDDFICQVNYEAEHPNDEVLARWSHSFATNEWLSTEGGSFLMSPEIRAPMGSKAAVFAAASEAERARAELGGEVMDFTAAWAKIRLAGQPKAQE